MKVRQLFGTLRGRIFAALLAISLVPIAVLGGQGYHCAMQAVDELARKHLLAVADARSTAVTNWLDERARSIETLASLPTTVDLVVNVTQTENTDLRETARELLESFQLKNPSFGDITLYNLDWTAITQTADAAHTEDTLADPELRRSVKQSLRPVFGVAHGHMDEDVGLHVACSIAEPGGQVIAFLAANLEFTDSLTPVLQDRNGLYRTGKVFIVSEDLNVLTAPFPGEGTAFKGLNVSAREHAHGEEKPQAVAAYIDYKGNSVLGATIPVGIEGWRLVTEIDRKEAMAWLHILLVRSVATGLVTCIVVVVIAVWISRLVGKPLKRLVQISHRIRAGHVEERLEQMDVAEAEEVRKAFNAMLDELREKQAEIVRTATLAYVGELTSSIVHEMRNPLSSIKMNLQALCKAVEGDNRYEELGEIALQQTSRVERMLTDLLNFGKPVKLRYQPIAFKELAKATMEVVSDSVARKQVQADFDDRLGGVKLHVDKEQMCRALTNLVSNAVEAVPQGGRVSLAAKHVPGSSNEIEVAVLDSGPGLSEEALQRAFRPFFTTKVEGTGLGLPNVKKIVELHGGVISVENCEEGGAAFRIRLPAKCSNP